MVMTSLYKFRLFYSICFLCGIISVYSQGIERTFRHQDPAKLPSPFIADILQDSDGFLWIATRSGLCRFDGVNYKLFQNKPDDSTSLSNNYVRCLHIDKSGNLWLGTFGSGLSRFNKYKETFENYPNPYSLESNRIHRIAEDRNGKFWLATEGGGLQYFDPVKYKFTHTEVGTMNGDTAKVTEYLRSVLIDRNNTVWVGTSRNGLYSYDQASRKIDTRFNTGSKTRGVHDMKMTNDGRMYIASDSGMIIFNTSSRTVVSHFSQQDGLIHNIIYRILKDHSNNYWLTTVGGLSIYHSETGKFENYAKAPFDPHGLPEHAVISICEDNNGLMWLGGWNQGIFSTASSASGFHSIRDKPLDPSKFSVAGVTDVIEDTAGNIWLASEAGGLGKSNKNTSEIETYLSNSTPKKGVSFYGPWALLSDSRNRLWVTSHLKGIARISITQGKIHLFNQIDGTNGTNSNSFCTNIFEDSKKRIWFCSFIGLYLFDQKKNTFRQFKFKDKKGQATKPLNQLTYIIEGPEGILFIGTNGGGIISYQPDNGNYKIFSKEENLKYGIKNNIITGLLMDNSGYLWVSTLGGGIFITDGAKPAVFYNLSVQNGLAENTIECMGMDQQGDIWAGGNLLEKIHLNKESKYLKNIFQATVFRSGDALIPNAYTSPAFCCTKDGRVFMGGTKGITFFNPKEIVTDKKTSRVQLISIKLSGKELITDTAITYKKAIELNYNQNFISVGFANLGFYGLDASSCQYKLEGLQTEWVNAGYNDEADFTKLSPGEYTFKVRAINKDGYPGKETSGLVIKILPPWWKTNLFYSIVFLLILGSVIGIFRFRIQAVRKTERLRLAQELETLELELKALRSQMNPHFLFNSLISIDNFIWKNETKKASEYLGKFASLVRLVLENSRQKYVSLGSELELLDSYIGLEALRLDHSFEYQLETKLEDSEEEIQIMPMILQPFVENAIIHGLAGKAGKGILKINVEQKEEHLRVVIEDNGVGRKLIEEKQNSSLGMKMTFERVIKGGNSGNNKIIITDLKNEDASPAGTRVEINLEVPLLY